ncbi:MAG: hypothetical protein ACI4D6_02480 [Chordicoccus sp.]
MSTTLYMLGYLAWLLKDLIRSSSLFSTLSFANTVENILTAAFFALMLLALAQKPLSEREFFIALAVVGLALVSYTRNHYFYVISSAVCVVSCRSIDLKRVIKASYRLKAAWIAFHLTAYVIVYIAKPSLIHFDYRDGTGAMRHYFFLSQANTAAMLLAWTIIEFVYVNWDRLQIRDFLGLWVLFFIYNCFTDSRTSVMTLTVFLLLCALCKVGRIHEKALRGFTRWGYAGCAVLFPALAYGYLFLGSTFHALFTVLDTLLTGRLLYGSFGLDQYGLTVLGQPITWAGIVYWKGYWIDQVVFDNAYLYFAVALGIIWLILLSFAFYRVEKYLTVKECILVTIYILFAITENYTVDVVYCFPMLFISRLIYGMDGAGSEESYATADTPPETDLTLSPEADTSNLIHKRERRPESGDIRVRSISNALADALPQQEDAASPEKLRAEAERIRSEIRLDMGDLHRRERLSDNENREPKRRTEAETEKENREWLAKWRRQRHE